MYHTGDINRRESLGACGTSVYLQAAACKCVCIAATLCCGSRNRATRISSFYLCRRASYKRQWGATRTMARTGHRATLRKTAANFAIGITYVRAPEGFVGGVVDAERCVVRFMRKWQIRIAGEQRIVLRAAGLLSLRGAVILSFSRRHEERLAWNNAPDFLTHATRFSTLISNRPFLRRGRPIRKCVGDAHCDKRLPLHRSVIFIFIVPFVIQGNIISLRGVKLCKIGCNQVK